MSTPDAGTGRHLPVRRQRHPQGGDPRPAGAGRGAEPAAPRRGRRRPRARRAPGGADGRGAPTRRPRGRSSTGWPASSWPTRSSSSTTSRSSAAPRRRRAPGRGLMGVRVGVVVFPGSNCEQDTTWGLAPRRRRAGRALARVAGPRRRRRRRPAGRLRLRRLPARRRHRPLQPGDARRRRVRRRRRPRPGDLQRLPGPRRGRPRPRRAPAQPRPALRLPRGRDRARSASTRRSRAWSASAGRCGCRSPTARAATTPTRRRSTPSSATGQVLFRYVRPDGTPAGDPDDPANPNGSLRAIAGVMNAAGNVAGLMPHPERAAEALLGSADGLPILRSLVAAAGRAGGRRRSGVVPSAARLAAREPAAAAVPLHRALGLDRRGARRHRGEARPRPQRPRARDVQRHVERALLVQEQPAAPARRCPPAATTWSPGRARTPASSGSATGSRSPSRSSRTTTRAPSSRTRARPPASAGSCATSSRWAPGRSPSSTRSASATRPTPRTRHLVNGVVGGVGGYGNCVGVPTVGGELVFDPSYQGNPLVNVMAIGIVREDRIMRAAAPGPGNLVVLYGSTTGRDGIGGASVLASATFGDQDPSKRPAVQVGDPFAEKLLIEATLEIIERGLAEGVQDLGAAGITCGVCGDGRPGRDRDPRRPRRDPAPGAGDGAVRGDDQRVARSGWSRSSGRTASRRSPRSAPAGASRAR